MDEGVNGDTETIDITYTSTNADEVIFTIGKSKQILNPSGTVSLSETELFNGEGNYTVYFQGRSETDGTGNVVPVKFTVGKKRFLTRS